MQLEKRNQFHLIHHSVTGNVVTPYKYWKLSYSRTCNSLQKLILCIKYNIVLDMYYLTLRKPKALVYCVIHMQNAKNFITKYGFIPCNVCGISEKRRLRCKIKTYRSFLDELRVGCYTPFQ